MSQEKYVVYGYSDRGHIVWNHVHHGELEPLVRTARRRVAHGRVVRISIRALRGSGDAARMVDIGVTIRRGEKR